MQKKISDERFDETTFENHSQIAGACSMATFSVEQCGDLSGLDVPTELLDHPCVNATKQVGKI